MKAFLARAVVPAVAAFLTYTLPAHADDAPDVAPPIRIDNCTMSEHPRIENPERAGPRVSTADALTIIYSNNRDVAATEIHFRARYRGKTLNLVDRGSFAPHVKLTRGFSSFDLIFSGSPADCSVTSVTFSDGSHWDVPTAAVSPAPNPERGGTTEP